MCCLTHAARDAADKPAPELMAESEQWRCRCPYGNICGRRATGEDLLCDWCRGRDHSAECGELLGTGAQGEPFAQEESLEADVRAWLRTKPDTKAREIIAGEIKRYKDQLWPPVG